MTTRTFLLCGLFVVMLLLTGVLQSWNSMLSILNMCVISAIMALGINLQWGYAGLFNVGIMGFTAIGGLAGVLTATPPVREAWNTGGGGIIFAALCILLTALLLKGLTVWQPPSLKRRLLMLVIILTGLGITLSLYFPAREAIEAVDPVRTGFLGGLGIPILFSWIIGAIMAAGAAWIVGKVSLGLRSDYLAIATLGISEIIIAVLKNEEWLSRGVKNVAGLPRPVPYEADLQQTYWLKNLAAQFDVSVINASSVLVKLCYLGLFVAVLIVLYWLFERLLNAPWGRMIRAIRDNETAAAAMGKNVTREHLRLFVLGSAVVGMAGAMMTTLDGQFTPGTYHPLRFTFLIWVMVIVGGSGNNLGSILGAGIVWFFWIQSEPLGEMLISTLTLALAEDSPIRAHLLSNAAQSRLIMMGLVLLIFTRYAPKGLLPERPFKR